MEKTKPKLKSMNYIKKETEMAERNTISNNDHVSLNTFLFNKRKESKQSKNSKSTKKHSSASSKMSRHNSELIIFSEELNEFTLDDCFFAEIIEIECYMKYYFSVDKLKRLLELYKTAIEFYELTKQSTQAHDFQLRMQAKLSEPFIMKKMTEENNLVNEQNMEKRRSKTINHIHKSSMIERRVISKEETVNRTKMRIKQVNIQVGNHEAEANQIQTNSTSNDEAFQSIINTDIENQKSNFEKRLENRRRSKLNLKEVSSDLLNAKNEPKKFATDYNLVSVNMNTSINDPEGSTNNENVGDKARHKVNQKSNSCLFEFDENNNAIITNETNSNVNRLTCNYNHRYSKSTHILTQISDNEGGENEVNSEGEESTKVNEIDINGSRKENDFLANALRTIPNYKEETKQNILERDEKEDRQEILSICDDESNIEGENIINNIKKETKLGEEERDIGGFEKKGNINQKDNRNIAYNIIFPNQISKVDDSNCAQSQNPPSNNHSKLSPNVLPFCEVSDNNLNSNPSNTNNEETNLSSNQENPQKAKKQTKRFYNSITQLKEITREFAKEYSNYFYSYIVRKFLKDILDKSHLNLVKYSEYLKSNSINIKELEILIKNSGNESQKTALSILLEENKEELEIGLKSIMTTFNEDIQLYIERFEGKCFDSKYLELIVEKWKFDFISHLSGVLR